MLLIHTKLSQGRSSSKAEYPLKLLWRVNMMNSFGGFLSHGGTPKSSISRGTFPYLVGGLVAILYFPTIYWESNHPNWLSYFSEGWPNHQPVVNPPFWGYPPTDSHIKILPWQTPTVTEDLVLQPLPMPMEGGFPNTVPWRCKDIYI